MKSKGDVFLVYKYLGESPLDAVRRVKKENPFLGEKRIAYAGRLDPMAEGLLLLVAGEELKNFDSYLQFDKEYEAEILFGFSTDSYDILGIPETKRKNLSRTEDACKTIKSLQGEFTFRLPPFSGYNMKGKPLFWWALQSRLGEIDIPVKKAKIYSLEIEDRKEPKRDEIKEDILKKIESVKGDFRQKEITEKWKDVFAREKRDRFLLLKIKVKCSSGCYIRSIAQEAGERLGTGAVLFYLKRTAIGEHTIKDVT